MENMESGVMDELRKEAREKKIRTARVLLIIVGLGAVIVSYSIEDWFLPGCGLIAAGLALPQLAESFGV